METSKPKTIAALLKELETAAAKAFAWLKQEFTVIKKEAAIAVVVVERAKQVLESPVAQGVIHFVDDLIGSDVPEEVAKIAELALAKTLALLTGLQLTPVIVNNPDQLKSWILEMLSIVKKRTDKDVVYSTLAADIYREIIAANSDGQVTFAEAVSIVEDAYKEWKKSQSVSNGDNQ